MSDIPSRLSRWEPPRALKIGFLIIAALSFLALYAAKIYNSTVVYDRKVVEAIQAEPEQGQAHEFTLKDHGNRDVSLTSLRGKVVFLNFWASWCEPCREELPSLQDLARTMDPRDTVFLAVSEDEGWSPVDQLLGPGPQPFQLLIDPDKSIAHSYGTDAYPESYIIGRDGRLLYRFIGARDWSNVAAIKLLEKAGARRLPQPEMTKS